MGAISIVLKELTLVKYPVDKDKIGLSNIKFEEYFFKNFYSNRLPKSVYNMYYLWSSLKRGNGKRKNGKKRKFCGKVIKLLKNVLTGEK